MPEPATGSAPLGRPLLGRRVLVTGAGGQLGGYLLPALTAAGATVIGHGARPHHGVDLVVDITDRRSIEAVLRDAAPDAVVHAAAYTDVDGAERDPTLAAAVNAEGSANVAAAAKVVGAYLLALSTDFVFAGDGGAPYAESAPPHPLSVYGRTKLAGEQAVLAAAPAFAVARTAWLYGGPGKHFPRTVLSVLRDRGSMEVVDDEAGSPTWAADLAAGLVALVAARGAGVFHLANEGRATRRELAREVAIIAGFAADAVRPITTREFLRRYPLPARRPADSTLANTRAAGLGIRLRPWREAIRAYVPRLAVEFGLPPDPAPAETDEPALSRP